MTDNANEPTAPSPNAPKRGRPFGKKQTSEASAILALQQQLADLRAEIAATPIVSDQYVTPGPEAKVGQRPGEYVEEGKDPGTGRPILKKLRWSRPMIESRYPSVTFTPMKDMDVRPHGITRGEWKLAAGQEITVPSIVKDLYENSMRAIAFQVDGYPGFSSEQERTAFEATLKKKGPHATPVKHVDFGWSESALWAARNGTIDPTHEPEVGFPGGYNGRPLGEIKV